MHFKYVKYLNNIFLKTNKNKTAIYHSSPKHHSSNLVVNLCSPEFS